MCLSDLLGTVTSRECKSGQLIETQIQTSFLVTDTRDDNILNAVQILLPYICNVLRYMKILICSAVSLYVNILKFFISFPWEANVFILNIDVFIS